MFLLLFIIFIVLYAIHNHFYNNKEAKLFNKLPGPRTFPFVGNAFDLLSKPGLVSFFYQVRAINNTYNGIFRLWMLHNKHVIIYNPKDIGVVLSNQRHITKNRIYRFIHPWLKDGLLTSTGEKWQQRRKILTPAFHFHILKQFCTIFEEQSNTLIDIIKKSNGEAIEIQPCITNFTLNSICETSMGTNLDSTKNTAQDYEKAIHTIGDLFWFRIMRFWLQPDIIFKYSSTAVKQSKILKTLHDFTANVIKERRQDNILSAKNLTIDELKDENTESPKKRLAMLDLLLTAESEGAIDENGIREEVDTFMFEGHDTTTMGITFCLMLLANHPDVQKLAYEEVIAAYSNSSEKISINELNNMNYLERCIKEALRIYPSVPFIGRKLEEELNMGEYVIPAGTSIDIHIFDLHRDPKIYPNPMKFDPDRFLPENCVNRHPYAYIPFSAGPRNCIGQKFAILEEKTVISALLKNFILEPVTKPDDIYFSTDLVLRTRDPIKIKFIPRF